MKSVLTKLKSITKDQDPPSITEQGLDVRMVDFRSGKPHGVEYFNCSYLSLPERDWLLVRRSKFDPNIRVGVNDLMAFSLTDGVPQKGWPLKTHKHDVREHNEDGRVWTRGKDIYVSACTFLWFGNKWSGAHQSVWRFNDRWECKERFDPIYGHNGPTNGVKSPTGHEKNWLFYTIDDRLFLLYHSSPFTIVEFDWKFKAIEETKTSFKNPWRYGEIRGGSNPIIGPDGLLWTFFHSSLPMGKNQKRRYYMGALAYEPTRPFTVRKITPEPLLIGSKRDRWYEDKPAVVFPGSCTLKGDLWVGALGVNDLDCAIFKIPHGELITRSVEV